MRELRLVLYKCDNRCPYYEWEPDISCSNDDGNGYCKKYKRVIPDIMDNFPKFCKIGPDYLRKNDNA